MSPEVLAAIEETRAAEREQALFYRALGAAAELAEVPELAERFHDLHADEQHHLSRLTARIVEVGHAPASLQSRAPPRPDLADWEPTARKREAEEVARYERLLDLELDRSTRDLLQTFLGVERRHLDLLAGKWTLA